MKKLLIACALSLVVGGLAFAGTRPTKVTVTAADATATVSMTNANSVAVYSIQDIFIDIASVTTGDSVITLEASTTTNSVFVSSGTIASNGTGVALSLANIELPQEIGDYVTITRPATATGGVMTVTFVLQNY